MTAVIETAKKAKKTLGTLSRLSAEKKNQALRRMALTLQKKSDEILNANKKDLEKASREVKKGTMSASLFNRLKLDPSKLSDMVSGILQVASLPDPIGKVTLATEMDEALFLYRVSCPIGVIGVVFEARPDALVQIASLCLKSSNAVLLKGGKEADHSNQTLFKLLQTTAAECGIPKDSMALLESRNDVLELLKADGYVDLIIPRGSNALVSTIQKNTVIPVLGHAEGICHVYVDKAADLKKALDIAVDSKVQYPAACNAAETILVHREIAPVFLPKLVKALQDQGVQVRVDSSSIRAFGLKGVHKATGKDWKTEYGDLIVSAKVIENLDEAISHINTYGSHHTDSMVTEDREAFERFFSEVDSAGVFLNASTRFSDGFRYGFGAEVGISTGKLHPRGPVGLEGLVTYKYKIIGKGQTVALYSGSHPRKFTHRPVEPSSKESCGFHETGS